jgi:hypothetical protein
MCLSESVSNVYAMKISPGIQSVSNKLWAGWNFGESWCELWLAWPVISSQLSCKLSLLNSYQLASFLFFDGVFTRPTMLISPSVSCLDLQPASGDDVIRRHDCRTSSCRSCACCGYSTFPQWQAKKVSLEFQLNIVWWICSCLLID